MNSKIDYSGKLVVNKNGDNVQILSDTGNKCGGHKLYKFICPYCGNESEYTIIKIINHSAGCKKCSRTRSAKKQRKTHDEYIKLLSNKNPLVKLCDESVYFDMNTKIYHICSICKKPWLVKPNRILAGVTMCLKCSRKIKNSVFAEISQQYLYNMGYAEIEKDLGFKNRSTYDLYIPNENLIIEIQSGYHNNNKEYDNIKKEYAESLGYSVEWVDERYTNVFDFIKRFDINVTWDKIINNIDLSNMLIKSIVQLDTNGNLIKIYKGGVPEAAMYTGLFKPPLTLAVIGKYSKRRHYYKNYLWYTLDEYNSLNFKLQEISSNELQRIQKHSKILSSFKYIATKIDTEEIIIKYSLSTLAESLGGTKGGISSYLSKKSKYYKGYSIVKIDIDSGYIQSEKKNQSFIINDDLGITDVINTVIK